MQPCRCHFSAQPHFLLRPSLQRIISQVASLQYSLSAIHPEMRPSQLVIIHCPHGNAASVFCAVISFPLGVMRPSKVSSVASTFGARDMWFLARTPHPNKEFCLPVMLGQSWPPISLFWLPRNGGLQSALGYSGQSLLTSKSFLENNGWEVVSPSEP